MRIPSLLHIFTVIAIMLTGNTYAQEDRLFQGICTVASISSEKGPEGIRSAKPLPQERFYNVLGNKDLIEVDWQERKVVYRRKEIEGTFSSPRSVIIYSSQTNDEAWLIFREDKNQPPIFHTASPNGKTNTWGACALKWTTPTESMSIQRQMIPGIIEKLKKEDYAQLNRATSEGRLSACELLFSYSYLDHRSQRGMPVVLTGSFGMLFNPGKLPTYILKINARAMDSEVIDWKNIKPAFSTVLINGRNFDSNKTIDFTCESGGRCVGYGDPELSLLDTIVSKPSLNAEILISLEKGGMDHKFSLSDLARQSKNADDLIKFKQCAFDIANSTANSLRR